MSRSPNIHERSLLVGLTCPEIPSQNLSFFLEFSFILFLRSLFFLIAHFTFLRRLLFLWEQQLTFGCKNYRKSRTGIFRRFHFFLLIFSNSVHRLRSQGVLERISSKFSEHFFNLRFLSSRFSISQFVMGKKRELSMRQQEMMISKRIKDHLRILSRISQVDPLSDAPEVKFHLKNESISIMTEQRG